MKKLLVMAVMFLSITASAQNKPYYGYEIHLSDDCNRSWNYNNMRFSRLLWKGILASELKVYSEPGKEANLNEIFDSYRFQMEQEYYDSFQDAIFSREDSFLIMAPDILFILSEKADTMLARKDWIKVSSGSGIEFSYSLSYPEVLNWLGKSKAYWVNPFDVTDSTLFSNALKEQRFCYWWYDQGNAKELFSGGNYCRQLVADKQYLFKGVDIRYANLTEPANAAFHPSSAPLNFERVLINAFLQGKIKGYYPAYNTEILPADFLKYCTDIKYGEMEQVEDDNGQYIVYTYSPDEMYEFDLLSVKYEMQFDPIAKDSYTPQQLMLGYTYNTCIRGLNTPLISFSFEDCMKILEASGSMWYNLNNHADSCTIASAIKQNKICWYSNNVKDKDDRYYYLVEYMYDSAKCYNEIPMQGCAVNLLYDRTKSNITNAMHTEYTGRYFPVDPALPLYLHYRGERMLSKNEDSTLTFLYDLSEYIVEKVTSGNLAAYTNDSLNRKLTNAEFYEKMSVLLYLYDEEGNSESMIKDTLSPSSFYVAYAEADLFVNSKGKVTAKDRALRLVIPAQESVKGIELPLASFSYAELTMLMKKDKKGKALLKQITATQKNAKYVNVIDPYGNILFNVWDENKDAQAKAIHAALQPYLKMNVKGYSY